MGKKKKPETLIYTTCPKSLRVRLVPRKADSGVIDASLHYLPFSYNCTLNRTTEDKSLPPPSCPIKICFFERLHSISRSPSNACLRYKNRVWVCLLWGHNSATSWGFCVAITSFLSSREAASASWCPVSKGLARLVPTH